MEAFLDNSKWRNIVQDARSWNPQTDFLHIIEKCPSHDFKESPFPILQNLRTLVEIEKIEIM